MLILKFLRLEKKLCCIINHRYNIDSINVYTFVNNDSCNAPINSPYSLICLDRSFNDQIEYTHTADWENIKLQKYVLLFFIYRLDTWWYEALARHTVVMHFTILRIFYLDWRHSMYRSLTNHEIMKVNI